MSNPYVTAKRAEYDALRTTIEGIQNRAADEKRDLTEDELNSIKSQGDQARKVADEVTMLTEIDTRSAAVAQLGAQVDKSTETRNTSSTTAVDRDPGHYRSEADGGERSFFGDLFRAKEFGDTDAGDRLVAHNRALTSSSAGAGILPPKWLSDENALVARQTRRVADRVRKIALGNDPRPITLPKQTGATSVVTQAAEGDLPAWTDAFNTGVDTVTPQTVFGGQRVSRQLLDASTPAVDQLIYGDLIAAYNSNVEDRVVAAMIASQGTPSKIYATEAAYTTAVTPVSTGVPFLKDLRAAATAVRNGRKLPADIVIASISRSGSWLDITDLQGRPLIANSDYQVVNAFGDGNVSADGRILGLDILGSDGVKQYPESVVVARSQDTILFESNTLRFRYEEPDGPSLVRLGVWGYVGVVTRYAGTSVQRLQITAA